MSASCPLEGLATSCRVTHSYVIYRYAARLLVFIILFSVMADNLPPNKFLIKLGDKSNDVYFSDDTSSDSDEWVATNVVVDQGRVMQVWRHAKDGKKVVWVIIPVRGGFVVVKIWIKAKRKAYNVDMRKLRGRPDHAILTIMYAPAIRYFLVN